MYHVSCIVYHVSCIIFFLSRQASGMTVVCCLMNGIKKKSVAMQKQKRLQQQAMEFDQSVLDTDDIEETPTQYHVTEGIGQRGGVR